MANKFDIDSSADTHLLNETFHVFSKSPGSPTTTLGGARLKSGHTTTATDVWADEIPAFFNAATQAKFDLFQSKAVKDDLCLFGGKVYQHNGTSFVSLGTTAEVLVDGKTFSKNGKAVVKYHKGRAAINLTADNNNGDGSNNYTAKIYNAASGSTTFVPQFISAMDKMVDGIPSLAYDAVVSDSTGVLAEGLTADNDYICNSYAGVIQFNKARAQGTVTVSAWEYIGEKLTASLTELAKKVESVTVTAGEGVQAVTDTATAAGLSVSTKTITVEGQSEPVIVKALDIDVAEVSAQGVVTSGDDAKLVTATGAQNIATKVANDAITAAVADGSVIDTRIDEVISAATLADGQKIATTTDTTKLVNVEDVKTYVSENAKVTLTQGTGITVTPNGLASTSFTVAVDNTIATKKSVDDLSKTVDSNKTDLQGKIDAINTSLTTGAIHNEIDDVRQTANAAKATADTAVQSVTRASGSSTLLTVTDGTNATISLSTEVATKTDAANAASTAITTSLSGTTTGTIGGAISSAVSGLETKLTTGEGSLGAKVTALESSVNTITGTTIPNAITTAKNDAVTTVKALGLSATDSDDAGKVTVTLGGTVETPTITVTSSDIASAQSLTALETKVNNFHKAGVSYVVADTLPTIASGTEATYNGKVYLVNTGLNGAVAADGSRIEYMYVNKGSEESPSWGWEKIGTTTADLTGYVKSIATANGVSGVVNGNEATITVQDGTTAQKGIVKLASTHEASDTTKAATGATVAAAISGIASTSQSDNGVKVTTAGGSVTGVEVTTTSIVSGGSLVQSVSGDNLITAADALAAVKLAKPDNYVASVTGYNTSGSQVTSTQGAAIKVLDGRGTTVTANDLWGTTVNVADGVITVDHKYLSNPNGIHAWNISVKSVKDNKAYTSTDASGEPLCNIQTEMIKDGSYMFSYTSLASFSGDLSSLVNGTAMFNYTPLESFNSDLSSLVNGTLMFSYTSLTSFSGDLSSLVNGSTMFYYTSLTSFSGDLSSLVNGSAMFSYTSLASFSGDLSSLVNGSAMFSYTSLASFSGDLSSLVNGTLMFSYTSLASFSGDLSSLVNGTLMFSYTSLTSFSGDLSSLVNGSAMFSYTSLDVESVELICDVLPNYNTENGGKKLQTCTWDSTNGKYTYSDWTSGSTYYYPIIEINNSSSVDGIERVFSRGSISSSNVKSISIYWRDVSALSEADRTAITKLFTDTATEKGWTFVTNSELGGKVSPNAVMAADGTVQYYIFAKKDEATEDDATHIDAEGKLWKFDTAEAIIGPNVQYWSLFATVEDALAEWGLTPWTKPTEEETEA